MSATHHPEAPRLPWAVRDDLRRAGYWIEVEQRLAPYFGRAEPLASGWGHHRLVQRRVSDPSAQHTYLVFGPQDTALEAVVRVARACGTMARGMEAAKYRVGLGHYELRRWTGWYRHITLAMWAMALQAAQLWGDDDASC